MFQNMPQEIEVKYILPAIRREFSKILVREKKYSQKQAAKILDITEAAVSQYFNSRRAKEVVFTEDVIQEMRNSIDKLIANHSKPIIIGEIYRICNLTTVRQILCGIHKAKSKDLEECKVCFEGCESECEVQLIKTV